MIDKNLNKQFEGINKLCKLCKAHATNIILMDNGVVAMNPVLEKVRNYMILHEPVTGINFGHLYINVVDGCKIAAGFRKTQTEMEWYSDNGQAFLMIRNPKSDPVRIPVLAQQQIDFALNSVYNRIPNWEIDRQVNLMDEPDDIYTPTYPDLAVDLYNKKRCELHVRGSRILISKQFLGDTKNTREILYRVISDSKDPHGKIVLKFKQKEELGNIYTFAAFIKIQDGDVASALKMIIPATAPEE